MKKILLVSTAINSDKNNVARNFLKIQRNIFNKELSTFFAWLNIVYLHSKITI